MKIEEIDKNFKSSMDIPEDVCFYDVREDPFRGYGLYHFKEKGPEDGFRRMPQDTADRVSQGVGILSRHTAGGRVRFKTDSRYLVLRSLLRDSTSMAHMTFVGASSFAVYLKEDGQERFYQSIIPAVEVDLKQVEGVVEFPDRRMRDIIIYFPLYCGVRDLWIGTQEGAALEPGGTYRHETPVLYYGSSITQGGCASRPGNSYQGFLCRMLDCDYINLGVSGSAKGEAAMAEYAASLEASVFVMDYDHNTPSPEHLEKTHETFFQIYRRENPETPVIFINSPKVVLTEELKIRKEIIRRTYENARRAGDENVYFIDGQTMLQIGDFADGDCTVDGAHPTDLGFYRMALRLEPVLRPLLEARAGK